MLRPQSTATREVVSLDGLWNFEIVDTTPTTDSAWVKRVSDKWQAPVPASYNDVFLDYDLRNHVGWVKYQRRVQIPRSWKGSRYFVRCDAATHRGRIYANEKLLVDHQGGYTPFDADITEVAIAGSEVLLTIAVSNELSNETIPPGTVETLPNGKKKQMYMHDFFNYSGLARSVWLYSIPTESITDVTLTPDIDWEHNEGILRCKVEASSPLTGHETHCKVSVKDEDGIEVATATGLDNHIKVPSVHLWQPGAAYLYEVTIKLCCGPDDSVLDIYRVKTGIRTVQVKGSQFLINNQPFYFTGFGKHEDSPIRGKGHDPAYMVHDFQLIDWIGANSFRTSHYPYAEEVLDYADRQGIVVIDETAAVGLNLGVASGLFGNKAPLSFTPDTFNDNTRKSHEQGIRELIARDKNHPCVVMWSIANEPASHEEGAREYFEPLVDITRNLDARPICFANFGLATSEKDLISDMFDVLCLNRYYGWYERCGDMRSAEQELEKDLLSWQTKYKKPMIMTEYGADCVAGLHAAATTPWSEEFQADILDLYHKVFDRVDCLIGEQVWSFSDFQTSQHVFRVDGNKKGVFTRDRRPKNSAQILRRRWRIDGVGQRKVIGSL
ncbi:glycoside hydrolase superfamily [Phaeosphaeria sp. MPI-PUGE-AT-0046c]|nr:glycoside hydrolase superfamily [Phaeosphaeria sp. MPI-PUGE-AT-0046c]